MVGFIPSRIKNRGAALGCAPIFLLAMTAPKKERPLTIQEACLNNLMYARGRVAMMALWG